MTYGFGKTYTIPAKFTALNGTIQYYQLTANVALTSEKEITDESSVEDKMEVAAAQANFLRVLEVLRTYGGQPVITKAEGQVVEFTLEQSNVFGQAGDLQVSNREADADKTCIRNLFKNVPAIVARQVNEDEFVLEISEESKDEEGTVIPATLLVAEDADIVIHDAF